jgi:hypothetical protein
MENEAAGRAVSPASLGGARIYSGLGLSAFPVPNPSGTGTSREWFPMTPFGASFRAADHALNGRR